MISNNESNVSFIFVFFQYNCMFTQTITAMLCSNVLIIKKRKNAEYHNSIPSGISHLENEIYSMYTPTCTHSHRGNYSRPHACAYWLSIATTTTIVRSTYLMSLKARNDWIGRWCHQHPHIAQRYWSMRCQKLAVDIPNEADAFGRLFSALTFILWSILKNVKKEYQQNDNPIS